MNTPCEPVPAMVEQSFGTLEPLIYYSGPSNHFVVAG
jgi:hypothetical protein